VAATRALGLPRILILSSPSVIPSLALAIPSPTFVILSLRLTVILSSPSVIPSPLLLVILSLLLLVILREPFALPVIVSEAKNLTAQDRLRDRRISFRVNLVVSEANLSAKNLTLLKVVVLRLYKASNPSRR
jgi:hypothetical protein